MGIFLCRLSDLDAHPAKGCLPDEKGQDTVFVVHDGNTIRAYKDMCPHYGATALPWKKDAYLDANKAHIVCAAHGALFNMSDGLCVRGPCIGESLISCEIFVTDDGEIWLASETQ